MSFFSEFKENLTQTIWWCSQKSDITNPYECLRTEELRPEIFEESRASAVQTVIYRRLTQGEPVIRNLKPSKNLAGGKLIVYFPNMNLACGVSQDITEGFFDHNNVPPWDTWISYFNDSSKHINEASYLVSWIPPVFIDSVDKAINAIPEECVLWLEDSDTKISKKLSKKRFLFL